MTTICWFRSFVWHSFHLHLANHRNLIVGLANKYAKREQKKNVEKRENREKEERQVEEKWKRNLNKFAPIELRLKRI